MNLNTHTEIAELPTEPGTILSTRDGREIFVLNWSNQWVAPGINFPWPSELLAERIQRGELIALRIGDGLTP